MKGKIVSTLAVGLSINYQNQMNKTVKFNDESVGKTVLNLKPFFKSPDNLESLHVAYILTPSPKFTAIKVIAAFQHSNISELVNLKQEDRLPGNADTPSNGLHEGSIGKLWMTQAMLEEWIGLILHVHIGYTIIIIVHQLYLTANVPVLNKLA